MINALMRDMFTKDEFSRMMSFVILVMTIAPLLAPMIGGALLLWFSWHAIFWTMGAAALIGSLLVALFIGDAAERAATAVPPAHHAGQLRFAVPP